MTLLGEITLADRKHTPSLDILPSARVVTVGDGIRDRWIYGRVDRISPEAPVPVFVEERVEERPGGAANVQANLAALGIAGYGNTMLGRGGWKAPIKERFIVGRQQIFRRDIEEIVPLSQLAQNDIVNQIKGFHTAGCLILSDYGKGTLTADLCMRLIQWARFLNIPIVVDPKGDDWSKYEGATVVTPNMKEYDQTDGRFIGDILITKGADGMLLWRHAAAVEIEIPAQAKEVFDVTGAGDTVVAILGACLAVGFDMETAARIANAGAGVVVGKPGTATCSLAELKEACVVAGVFNDHGSH